LKSTIREGVQYSLTLVLSEALIKVLQYITVSQTDCIFMFLGYCFKPVWWYYICR